MTLPGAAPARLGRYELLARLLKARTEAEGAAPKLGTLLKIDRIENHKADVNNNGAFSTNNLGMNYDWPEGDSPGPV